MKNVSHDAKSWPWWRVHDIRSASVDAVHLRAKECVGEVTD